MVTTITQTITKTSTINISCNEEYCYVSDSDGDDGNDGSQAHPWKTLTKVNSLTFAEGDHIFFKRGDTFSGRLLPNSSGLLGNPILFGSYSTGARPIIDGTTGPNHALYIPDTTDIRYLRFDGLSFYGCNGDDVDCVQTNTDNLYFYDCEISYSTGLGVGIGTYDGTDLFNIIFDTCHFHHNKRSGIYIGSTIPPYPHSCLITNSESDHNGWNGTVGCGFYIKGDVIGEYLYSHDNILEGGFKSNISDGAGMDATIYFPVYHHCISIGDQSGFYISSNGAKYYNNLVIGSLHALVLYDYVHDTEVYFNTFINPANTYICICVSGPISIGNKLKNNIFIMDGALGDGYYLDTTQAIADCAANNTIDYNIYYHTNTIHNTYYSEADGSKNQTQWKALAAAPDAHSTYLSVVPDFVARYSDMHPANGGNLKGLGLAISGYELDYDGHTRADPPTPGCYEEDSI